MRPMEKLFAGGQKRDSLRIIGTLVGVSPAEIAGYAKDTEKLKSARARTLALLIQRARLTPEETAEVIAELAK